MEEMKNKICFVVSTLSTVHAFMDNHIRVLSESFDVYIVAYLTEKDGEYLQSLPIKGYKHIGINRKIHLIKDLKAVIDLIRYFRKEKFYAVHSITPKAGLVNALAGILAGIKNRIHIYTGQVWASREGMMRTLLKSLDQLIARLNTHNLVDGNSQREFLIEEKVLTETNSQVLANGSIAGVDTVKFSPDSTSRNEIRNVLGIKNDQVVFIFMGRLCKDKGIDELLEAFSMLQKVHSNAYLLLVGSDEENYTEKIKKNYSNLVDKVNFCLYGLTPTPARVLNAGDVFCLPSYREGFGMSIIEASCLGLPVICSDVYGVMDAMIDDKTGLRCKVKDTDSLYHQMKRLSVDSDLRTELGSNGRDFVLKNFSGDEITKAWLEYYRSL